VRWQPNWDFLRKYTISTPLWWSMARRSIINPPVTINTARNKHQAAIDAKLSSSISYQFVKETSGQQGLNYTDNIVGLSFSYQF